MVVETEVVVVVLAAIVDVAGELTEALGEGFVSDKQPQTRQPFASFWKSMASFTGQEQDVTMAHTVEVRVVVDGEGLGTPLPGMMDEVIEELFVATVVVAVVVVEMQAQI